MTELAASLPGDFLHDFCTRWQIVELAAFGSVLREDFRADSDVDLLVTFRAGAPWSLLDVIRLKQELEARLGRSVDLVETTALKNPFRREAILRTKRVLYAG